MVKSGMQQSVMSEKNVQMMCVSKFFVKLHEAFNGEQFPVLPPRACDRRRAVRDVLQEEAVGLGGLRRVSRGRHDLRL